MLDSQYANDVLGFVNPTPDGNCGFRAVSAAVFGHEEAWIQVKKMMLATFLKYANSIYDSYGLNEAYITTKLQSTKALCLDNLNLWFDCYGCPQIVADTFRRPVILHATTPKTDKYDNLWRDDDGNVIYTKDAITLVPFLGLDLEKMNEPIVLFFINSHFYMIEPIVDSKTKKAIIPKKWPTINFSRQKIFNAHRDIWVNDVSEY